jgi:alanyl-tRNA synthetase
VLSIVGYDGFVQDTRAAASQDQPVGIVSDRTSFYAETGGQVGGWAMCMMIGQA